MYDTNIESLFNEQEQAYTIKFCGKIIADNFNLQDMKDSIDNLSYVTNSILPKLEKGVYISTVLSILYR